LDSIYIAYAMYMICIFFVYTDDIPKLTPRAVAAEDIVGQDDSEAEWIANNYAEELNVTPRTDPSN
jgi:hypothetical protein